MPRIVQHERITISYRTKEFIRQETKPANTHTFAFIHVDTIYLRLGRVLPCMLARSCLLLSLLCVD